MTKKIVALLLIAVMLVAFTSTALSAKPIKTLTIDFYNVNSATAYFTVSWGNIGAWKCIVIAHIYDNSSYEEFASRSMALVNDGTRYASYPVTAGTINVQDWPNQWCWLEVQLFTKNGRMLESKFSLSSRQIVD